MADYFCHTPTRFQGEVRAGEILRDLPNYEDSLTGLTRKWTLIQNVYVPNVDRSGRVVPNDASAQNQIDLLLICDQGFLVLEVKGDRSLRIENGSAITYSEKDPVEQGIGQANTFARRFRSWFGAYTGRGYRGWITASAMGVFPYIDRHSEAGRAAIATFRDGANCLLFREDLENLEKCSSRFFEHLRSIRRSVDRRSNRIDETIVQSMIDFLIPNLPKISPRTEKPTDSAPDFDPLTRIVAPLAAPVMQAPSVSQSVPPQPDHTPTPLARTRGRRSRIRAYGALPGLVIVGTLFVFVLASSHIPIQTRILNWRVPAWARSLQASLRPPPWFAEKINRDADGILAAVRRDIVPLLSQEHGSALYRQPSEPLQERVAGRELVHRDPTRHHSRASQSTPANMQSAQRPQQITCTHRGSGTLACSGDNDTSNMIQYLSTH